MQLVALLVDTVNMALCMNVWVPGGLHGNDIAYHFFEARHSLINALALNVMINGRNNLAVQLYEPVNQSHSGNHSKIIKQTYTYITTLYSAIGQSFKSTKFALLPDTRF